MEYTTITRQKESPLKELLKATKHEINLEKAERKKKKDFPLNDDAKKAISDIEELEYDIIPGYYSPETCEEVKAEVFRLMEKYTAFQHVDAEGSDHRLFGADAASELISQYYNDFFIRQVTTYFERTPKYHGFTMAAHMTYKEGNVGSGGGWHRDRADKRQLKVLMYLTDVTEKNGPFQYYEGSHTPTSILQSVLQHGFSYNQNRFTDEEISRIDQSKLRTATGKAGTLLIADVRGLHRGMPIEEGERTILMNYVWGHAVPKHIRKLMIPG